MAVAFAAGCKVSTLRSDLVIADMQAKAIAAANESKEDSRKIEQLQRDVANAIALADQLRSQKRETVEKVVTNEIIKYVQTDAAANCGLDANGVRIHDIAASGELPSPAITTAPPDAGAGGSSAAEVIQVVAGNYGICHQARDRLLSLQDWMRDSGLADR